MGSEVYWRTPISTEPDELVTSSSYITYQPFSDFPWTTMADHI